MDLYAPPEAARQQGRPLVVFWYGGSWQSGSRKEYRFVGAALAARGAVTVVPDYRLYPEVRFPEFLRDAAAAVARAQLEAPRYGADPRRTVLGGHSAGAWIAAMLALQPAYLREAGVDPASIAGFFGLSGPYDIDPNSAALHAIFTEASGPETWKAVAQVSERAPPALLVHGSADDLVYPAHSEKLAAALRAKGVAVEVLIVPKRGHADTVAALSRPGGYRIPDLLEQVSGFIARVPAR
jgi:acetyl esterase/lipase